MARLVMLVSMAMATRLQKGSTNERRYGEEDPGSKFLRPPQESPSLPFPSFLHRYRPIHLFAASLHDRSMIGGLWTNGIVRKRGNTTKSQEIVSFVGGAAWWWRYPPLPALVLVGGWDAKPSRHEANVEVGASRSVPNCDIYAM